jgi:acetyl-CoA carboxylase carboxyltransferase component
MSADSPPTSLLRPLADDLHARREQIKLGGGADKIAAQHEAEKLTARERLGRTSASGRWRAATPPPTA